MMVANDLEMMISCISAVTAISVIIFISIGEKDEQKK